MQNIDIAYILQPVIVVAIALFLVFYSHRKHRLTFNVLAYSFLAYSIAIFAKSIFQALTYSFVLSYNNLFLLGLYFGMQTVLLEVGLAYLFAKHAVGKAS